MSSKDNEIIDMVSKVYGIVMEQAKALWQVSEEDLWSSSQRRNNVDRRTAVVYLTYRYALAKNLQVLPSHLWHATGQKRDRSTFYHMLNAVDGYMYDPTFRTVYTELKNNTDENIYRH